MNALIPAEEEVMRDTFKASMFRAAAIIDRITASDVLDAQRELLREGMSLMDVAKIDRALLASCYLRACAETGHKSRISTDDVRRRIEG